MSYGAYVDEYEIIPCLSATLFNAPAPDSKAVSKELISGERQTATQRACTWEVGPLTIQVEQKTTNYGERAERHEQRSRTAKSPL